MGSQLNEDGTMKEARGCECCAPRMVTATVTTHVWTREEIEQEIIYRATRIVNLKWFNREYDFRMLRHWVAKYELLTPNEQCSHYKVVE